VRATLVQGIIDNDRVSQAAAAVREELVPAFLSRPGARHAYWMVHRPSGRLWIMTVWKDREHLMAAAAAEAVDRTSVADRLGARILGVQELEVAGAHEEDVDRAPRVRWVRATWLDGLPSDHRGRVPELFNEVVPDQARTSGFCASYWLVDAAMGVGLGLSFWEGPAEIRHSEQAGRRRVRRVETALGCRVTSVRELEAIGVASTLDPPDVPPSLDLRSAATQRIPVGELGTSIERPPGALLAVPGEVTDQVVVLLDGHAAMFQDGNGAGRLVAGDHFGGHRIADRRSHSRTVITTSPAKLEVISRSEFASLSHTRPDVTTRFFEEDAEP
jgi:hypothetical protein